MWLIVNDTPAVEASSQPVRVEGPAHGTMAMTEITDRIIGFKTNFAALASSCNHGNISGLTVRYSIDAQKFKPNP